MEAETLHDCGGYLNVAHQVLLFQPEYYDLQLKIERSENLSIVLVVGFS
jgi:hypothetical protein